MIDSYKLPAYFSSQNSTENSQFYHELDLKDYISDNGIDITKDESLSEITSFRPQDTQFNEHDCKQTSSTSETRRGAVLIQAISLRQTDHGQNKMGLEDSC